MNLPHLLIFLLQYVKLGGKRTEQKSPEHTGRDEGEANGLLDGAVSVSTAWLTAIEYSKDIYVHLLYRSPML